MDSILQLTPRQRAELFIAADQKNGMGTVILEKDFWVCWTLQQLFSLPALGEKLIFKGGTSLSKVFKIIERFSEDIDVSIDREFLGFGGSNEPGAGGSKKERQRRVDGLRMACQKKIAEELKPALEKAFRLKIGNSEEWSLVLDKADPDQQTLLFTYPQALSDSEAGYIRRLVKIEIGARADHWPCEKKPVTPYVAETFPEQIPNAFYSIKVLSVERTFWEKATILHAEYHRPIEKPMPERFSRHYCDFYELIRKGVDAKALTKIALLDRVAQHKSLFFKSSWAKYEDAVRGTLRIYPNKDRLKALKDDYQRMQEMFFGKPIQFEEMMDELKKWEKTFNRKSAN